MAKRHTIEFIRNEFEKEGYQLLSKSYKNAHQRLNYICPKGHSHFIEWCSWKSGHRCVYCGIINRSNKRKLDIKFIKKEFKKEEYILLTKKYTNNKQKLNYICPNGHKHEMPWGRWRRGDRCPYCSGCFRKNIDFIKAELKKEKYKLLSKYYNNDKQKLKCICSRNHTCYITWNNWKKGARCQKCRSIKMIAFGNPNWKGGISCEPYCQVWSDKEYKKSIRERDNHICQNPYCYNTSKRIAIHHIDYNKKNCGPENLITLCTGCNSRANTDRAWHIFWYQTIMNHKYKYVYNK